LFENAVECPLSTIALVADEKDNRQCGQDSVHREYLLVEDVS
jgi:hypothetical protein